MPWKIKLYIGSLDEAYDCACLFDLLHCTPASGPLWAYTFNNNSTLLHFAIDFCTNLPVQGTTIIVPDWLKTDAEASIQQLDLSGYVQVTEMFAVEVWDDGDEAVFDALFD